VESTKRHSRPGTAWLLVILLCLNLQSGKKRALLFDYTGPSEAASFSRKLGISNEFLPRVITPVGLARRTE